MAEDNQAISAIIENEENLETVVHLIEHIVDRHEVSVQASPNNMAKHYGAAYVNPTIIQQSHGAPKKEPFLRDDFGWVLGFSFSLPFICGIIVGIALIGDIMSTHDNFLYGALGGLVGAFIGLCFFMLVKKYHDRKIQVQEEKGGFVLWINHTNEKQIADIIPILKSHGAHHISIKHTA